jgi:hypothetical protein
MANQRKRVPNATELMVLDRSRRRCALCFQMRGDLTEKRGQIAHLDQNPANFAVNNLAWLCLEHHSEYDSRTSQHKNYTEAEVKQARSSLYQAIQEDRHFAAPAVRTEGRNADRHTLSDIIQTLREPIALLRSSDPFGKMPFPVRKTALIGEFLHRCREPECEFVDHQLEIARQAMINRLDRLNRLIIREAKPTTSQDEWRRFPIEWADDKPTYYAKMIGRFDSVAKQVCDRYDTLVREARRKLEP